MVEDRLPENGNRVLWVDSTGIIQNNKYATIDEVSSELGFLFDSWVEVSPREHVPNEIKCDPIKVEPESH